MQACRKDTARKLGKVYAALDISTLGLTVVSTSAECGMSFR
jgi:hypothetical protein